MLRTLQTARQSLHLEQTRIDTLANNLANAATSGFRQVLTRVTERIPGSAEGAPEAGASGRDEPGGLQAGRPLAAADGWAIAQPLLMSQAVDMRPGSLEATGRHLDVAISGRGFFVVRDGDGAERYTRDGGFNLDAAGNLVTAGGQTVQGAGGPIQAGGGTLTIDTAGAVLVDGQERGRLRVVDFEAPHRLTPHGDGLLEAAADMAATDVPPAERTILQGHLEGSNVDPVRTLVDMISAQRAFEIATKVVQANDEMLGQSVNTLGRNA